MKDENDLKTSMTLLRRWEETEGHELEDPTDPRSGWRWPAPPEYREYRVEGKLRLDVLERVGRHREDACDVRLIQGWVEGGYSEYTVEHDYPIEVWIHEGRQAQRVWSDDCSWSEEKALAAFLAWVIPPVQRVHNHPPYRPVCNERDVNGALRGACLNDDGSDR